MEFPPYDSKFRGVENLSLCFPVNPNCSLNDCIGFISVESNNIRFVYFLVFQISDNIYETWTHKNQSKTYKEHMEIDSYRLQSRFVKTQKFAEKVWKWPIQYDGGKRENYL